MKIVATPFLTEDMNQSLVCKPLHPGSAITCPWCNHSFQAESKTDRSLAAAVCLSPQAMNGEGNDLMGHDYMQPCSDSIDNFA
eukprot:2552469-Heterocapsa_arctica.AAC.1